MSVWETIFIQSPANEGYYDEEQLPQTKWDWPKDTWFQARLDRHRKYQPALGIKASRAEGCPNDLSAMRFDRR